MTFPQRRLPHRQPDGKRLFLTWHLHGSLPVGQYPPLGLVRAGEAFVWIDRRLDRTRLGPMWLRVETVANLVVESIHYAAEKLQYYELHAYVVMPNHVHLLVLPRVSPSKFLHSVKTFTAREANRILHRMGEPFWQGETYDHWIRDDIEFARIKAYIENNPVKAGLVARAEDYRWSSGFVARASGRPAGL